MQTIHLSVLIHIWTRGEVGALLDRFKPASKLFLLAIPRRCFFCVSFMLCCLVLLCFHARLFVDALWSPAGKGETLWLSFVMSDCDVVTFPLISWVRCGAWLYWFLIFALSFASIKTTLFSPSFSLPSSSSSPLHLCPPPHSPSSSFSLHTPSPLFWHPPPPYNRSSSVSLLLFILSPPPNFVDWSVICSRGISWSYSSDFCLWLIPLRFN